MAANRDEKEKPGTGQEESKGFVVKDKRRFDSSGRERSESENVSENISGKIADSAIVDPAVNSQSKPESAAMQQNITEKEENQAFHGEMNFSSFVMSLATQALMQLGEIKPPPGMELEIDRNAARQSIDILGMLQDKTKNNLDKEEAHLLEQILHNLRLSYVKAVS